MMNQSMLFLDKTHKNTYGVTIKKIIRLRSDFIIVTILYYME